ncbi:MAG TPA: HPr kinase/phosphatase C-terminal domain-containing protein [Novosphingobium sp.]
MTARQSTCIAIGGRALLIEGPSGAGKSSLALALIDRGAELIGDDSVILEVINSKLIARPHPNTQGLIEVRNLGLLPFPVRSEAPVALVVRLDQAAPRFVEEADAIEIAGLSIPLIRLWPGGTALPMKAELALSRFGLSCG